MDFETVLEWIETKWNWLTTDYNWIITVLLLAGTVLSIVAAVKEAPATWILIVGFIAATAATIYCIVKLQEPRLAPGGVGIMVLLFLVSTVLPATAHVVIFSLVAAVCLGVLVAFYWNV